MPKSVNRPRDDVDAQQMQQGQADFAKDDASAQMGDAATPDEADEQRSPA